MFAPPVSRSVLFFLILLEIVVCRFPAGEELNNRKEMVPVQNEGKRCRSIPLSRAVCVCHSDSEGAIEYALTLAWGG